MKYFSMFSGIGGFELGIQNSRPNLRNRIEGIQQDVSDTKEPQVRATCIGYSEIDKYAIQIYQKQFKGHKNYGDCTEISWKAVSGFDILVGGFPCQSFSIAGKRGGFEDVRGTLFFEIARCLREKQPRICVLENVKGLLSHDKGETFFTILSTLDELGYDCQWQVLNSKNFGVPQNRERVFIIGHLRGTSRPEVFPIGESEGKSYDESVQKPNGGCTRPIFRVSESEKSRREIQSRYSIRRLTPTECERLQGFPDGWTEGISDTQRYKCLGNAVTVNVIETIMGELMKFVRTPGP
jgi:DNA-cytosine methyltransferase